MVIARQAPQTYPPMIPFCSRFDSVLFTPKMTPIAGCFNFSRSPIQGCGATIRGPQAGSPPIVIPIAPSVPSCSKPSRCGLARMGGMRRSGTRSLGKTRCSWHERGAATFDPRQIEIARPHTVDRVDPLDLLAHAAMTGATARTGLSLTAKPWHHPLVKEATRPLVDDRFNLRGFLGEGQSHWSRRADLSFDNLSFARSGGGGLRADCARSAPSEPDRNRDWHRDRNFERRSDSH